MSKVEFNSVLQE